MPIRMGESGILYITDESGVSVPFCGIAEPLKFLSADTENIEVTDCSGEIICTIPISGGQRDILCGRLWTGAARRYMRKLIRRKEKERRRSLKAHENH